MYAEEFPSDGAVFSDLSTRYRGDIALTADFANAVVKGVMDNLESREGRGSYSSVTGRVTFNAVINGSNMTTADLNQNINVRGAFFGPSAEEAAGVFDALDQVDNTILIGWFGTAKDE